MNNTRGKNTKRKHLSKNKKKSWRKVNVDDIEDFLEDERLQERTGGKVSEKSDESLFFVDKKKTKVSLTESKIQRKRKAQDKLTDVEETLKPPPPKKKDKRAPDALNKLASGKVSTVQRIIQKQRKAAEQGRLDKRLAKQQRSLVGYDLWGDKLEREHEGEDPHFLAVTRRRRVNTPSHYQDVVSKLPAVEVPHAGASYNPAFSDHQELLKKATEVEVQKVRKEEKLLRALDSQFPTRYEAPTEASRLAELATGLFDDESDDNEDVGDIDKISCNPPVRRDNKKDEKRRKRDKKEKQKKKKTQEEKLKKSKDTDNRFSRLKAIKREVRVREQELEKRVETRTQHRAAHLYRTHKLGKLKYVEPDEELKLTDELRGSLRELKPEGHLLDDRYRSLQKRNIIEPRQRAKKPKKYKAKVFERKGHRAITS